MKNTQFATISIDIAFWNIDEFLKTLKKLVNALQSHSMKVQR